VQALQTAIVTEKARMKLEDLRKLLEAPKTPKTGEPRTITGVDLGYDIAASVGTTLLQCKRCDMVMTVSEHLQGDIVFAFCPRCDAGCVMCGRTHDENGDPLEIRETGTEKRPVCNGCRVDYYDPFLDVFLPAKQP
jgi:uncharacterized C2H2 Zn-finger protein